MVGCNARTMPTMATVQLRPDRFAAGGEAIARDADGRIVFVRGALPGETVTAELVQEKRDWARAHVIDVVEASADRITPPCGSRLAGCGGCGWMHLELDAQRRAKLTIAEEALRRTGGLVEPVMTLGPSVDPMGYRTTARVAAGPNGAAGFRAEHSHDVVAAPACLVLHPTLRALVADVRLDPGVEATLRMSVATGDVAARWDRSKGGVHGLPPEVQRGGTAAISEDVDGHRLRVSIASFFQSGPQAAALLVDAVRRAAPELGDATVVVDAYAGVGMFAVCATVSEAHVVAIETSRSAVADAEANLGDRRHEIVRGEVGGWRAAPDLNPDVVIADPARSGLGAPGTNAITRVGAPLIVLVSCDPASLGRDAKLLGQAGYAHVRSEVIDTFPQTTHIEVVSRFEKVMGQQC
jgi:23S rRNA (uracil1939-C5)-methyltransferase